MATTPLLSTPSYSASTSYTPSYPTYANDFNIGSGTAGQATATATPDTSTAIPGAASSPDYASEQVTVTAPDTSSRGFNPWSLTGEANARGK